MKIKSLFLFFIFIMIAPHIVFAEERRPGEFINLERSPSEIRIIYRTDDVNRPRAVYTHYLTGSRRDTSCLSVTTGNRPSIDISINVDENISEIRIGVDFFSCDSRRNRVLCGLATVLVRVWYIQLNIERKIEEAMQMPPFDFSPYMPPE